MNAIKQRRLELGLTQKELAAQLGVTATSVKNWESGECRPKDDMIHRLAEVLGCGEHTIISAIKPKQTYSYPAADKHPERAEVLRENAVYRERRIELGLSRSQLAELSSVSEHSIENIEAGMNIPRWDTQQKLRKAMRMPELRRYSIQERNEIFLDLQDTIRGMIHGSLSLLLNAGADPEDVFQDLAVESLRAIDRYQGKRGATVKTYVINVLKFRIKSQINRSYMRGMSGATHHYGEPLYVMDSIEALTEKGVQIIG